VRAQLPFWLESWLILRWRAQRSQGPLFSSNISRKVHRASLLWLSVVSSHRLGRGLWRDHHGKMVEEMAAAVGKRVDPLVLLRSCFMAKKKVRMNDEILELDGVHVHRSQKCGFKLSPPESCIDIGSIWFMYNELSRDKPYNQEVARNRAFKYIGVALRGDLCDFLVGRLDTCRGIVKDVIEGRKRPADTRDDEWPEQKPRRRRPPAVAAGEATAKATPVKSKEFKLSDITHSDVVTRVRPVQDLDVLVRCPGRPVPNADLILKIAQDEVANWSSHKRRPPRELDVNIQIPFYQELEKIIAQDRTLKPIILVPCNKNAPVNILNAAKFLQDGIYAKPDPERMRNFESTRMEYVDLVRNVHGKMWTFEVRDSAKNFDKAQWLRVVAVVTDGTAWQFAGWPFESVVDLFTTIKGVYFTEFGRLTPHHVKEWQCATLQMHPLQFQHRFSEVRDGFWIEVERFLSSVRVKKHVNHTALDTVTIPGIRALPVL